MIPRYGWCGIEARKGGKPVLARLRKVGPRAAVRRALHELLVVSLAYPPSDPSRLPDERFYRTMRRFEVRVLDALEDRDLAIYVFSETWNGTLRYFLYTRDVGAAADAIGDLARDELALDLSSTSDPGWEHYAGFERLAAGPGPESRKPRRKR